MGDSPSTTWRHASNDDYQEAIIRISSYHRRDFDRAVISFTDTDTATASLALLSPAPLPVKSLGQLHQLPLELINQICLQLDLASLLNLRKVNCQAREIVNSLREYRLLATHAPTCITAMLRTESASGITLSSLFQVFCDFACSVCQDGFGHLLSLLTWKRCCFICVYSLKPDRPLESPQIAVTTVAKAKRIWKIPATPLKRLHSLKTIPGVYTTWKTASNMSHYDKTSIGGSSRSKKLWHFTKPRTHVVPYHQHQV